MMEHDISLYMYEFWLTFILQKKTHVLHAPQARHTHLNNEFLNIIEYEHLQLLSDYTQ